MSILQIQIANEFKSTHHLLGHVQEDLIKSGLEHLAQDYVQVLTNHVNESDYTYVSSKGAQLWTSKKERHDNLMQMDLIELAWKVIAICTATEVQTYTGCVGMLKGMFKNDTDRQDIEQGSECVALLSSMNLIDIKLPKDAEEGVLMVYSRIKYDGALGEYLTTTRHVMPSLMKPKEIKSNKDSGYQTFSSSLILAGKYHSKPVPLDHINRVNGVALSINKKALEIDPVFKEDASETVEERLKRYTAWKRLNVESVISYAELVATGNKFYLTHKYDERLRTYAHGYQISTQGDSYRKSVIELANKEIVQCP
jgi:hypothetical protein